MSSATNSELVADYYDQSANRIFVSRLDLTTLKLTESAVTVCDGICDGPVPGAPAADAWDIMTAVDPDGLAYGSTNSSPRGTTAMEIQRVAPDDTAGIVAGNGSPDPGTASQYAPGTHLSLSVAGLAVTPHGGLLISSGHDVYRLDDAAHAPTAG